MNTKNLLVLCLIFSLAKPAYATRSLHSGGRGGTTWRKWKKENCTAHKEVKKFLHALKIKELREKKERDNERLTPTTPSDLSDDTDLNSLQN